jgi:hypothetical protein
MVFTMTETNQRPHQEQHGPASSRRYIVVFQCCILFVLVSQFQFGTFVTTRYQLEENNDFSTLPIQATTISLTNDADTESSTLVVEPTILYHNNHQQQQRIEEKSSPGLHVVISHCRQSVGWIFERYLPPIINQTTTLKSITIYSKCGMSPFIDGNDTTVVPSWAIHEELPNVGRCDHSYAYWISQFLSKWNAITNHSNGLHHVVKNQHQRQSISIHQQGHNSNSTTTIHRQDQVIFLKDTNNEYRRRHDVAIPLTEMWNRTVATGFSCGSRVIHRRGFKNAIPVDVVHYPTISTFLKTDYVSPADRRNNKATDNSNFGALYRPLGNWTDQYFNISFDDTGLYHSCYGGIFMTTIESIVRAPVKNKNNSYWRDVVSSLSRGDNIEEGHYMERMWSALLAPAIPHNEQVQLVQSMERFVYTQGLGYHGLLLLKQNSNTSNLTSIYH